MRESDMSSKPPLIRSMQVPPVLTHKYERYLPTAFDESMSILEKINKVIHHMNEVGRMTEDMLLKWNEVYEWVTGEGLELAIEGKLDEWLADGTLASIINEVLMKEINDKIDVIDGQIVGIDGKIFNIEKELLRIKDEVESDLSDVIVQIEELVNVKLVELEESKLDMLGYYDEITSTKYRDEASNTTYHLFKIPRVDKDGIPIKIRHSYTGNSYSTTNLKTTRKASVDNKATLAMNASPFSAVTGRLVGMFLKNGVTIQEGSYDVWNYILAIGDNNDLKTYPPDTSAVKLKAEGYNDAISGFIPLIQGGLGVSNAIISLRDIFNEPHPRTAIAQDVQGNTYFFVSEGRVLGEHGMYAKDVIRVLLSHGMEFAQMLDGGGSSQLVSHHINVNQVSGDMGAVERKVGNVLYVGKDKVNKVATKVLDVVGDSNMNLAGITSDLNRLRYQRNNYIELEPYLINGWENQSSSGSNACRAWIMPNNTIYFVGTITGGELSKPFMQLPPDIAPMFSTHHLVAGNQENQIYKIIVSTSGELQWYYWNTEGRPPNTNLPYYIKLDGIFVPLNTPNQGIQR